jgi:hypothetical protein
MLLIRNLMRMFQTTPKAKGMTVEDVVYETIKQYGSEGCISDDVVTKNLNVPYPSITARYKGMIEKEMIELTGETRIGRTGKSQRVMRVKV